MGQGKWDKVSGTVLLLHTNALYIKFLFRERNDTTDMYKKHNSPKLNTTNTCVQINILSMFFKERGKQLTHTCWRSKS